ncbi:MAG: patatin-like phospholipase family protein [Bacillota bacterium]
MLGLVLEGGGAKGSYQAGAIKALYEKGYKFDGVMGTSIGAINGALIAQNDIEKCFELWENIAPSKISDLDDEKLQKFFERKYDRQTLVYLFKVIKDIIFKKGIPTDKVMILLKDLINEDILRESKIDYGLVTVSLTDRMPIEIFKEEIPYGMLHDYIMASAYFPAFRIDPIQGKKYLDGGAYDNLPINPLIRKGYDEIIAIRTMSNMPHQRVVDDTVKISYINPSDDVGGTISVYSQSIEKNMKMGYFDAKKLLENHKGEKFYFFSREEKDFYEFLIGLSDDIYFEWKECLGIQEDLDKSKVIKRLFKVIRKELKRSYVLSDYEIFIYFLEKYAKKCGIERYRIYNIEDFLSLMKEYYSKKNEQSGLKEYLKSFVFNSTMNNIFLALIKNYK